MRIAHPSPARSPRSTSCGAAVGGLVAVIGAFALAACGGDTAIVAPPEAEVAERLAPVSPPDQGAVPFAARQNVDVVRAQPEERCGTSTTWHATGSGVGTQLGRYDHVQSLCFDAEGNVHDGEVRFIGAHGDELWAGYMGQIWPVAVNPDGSVELEAWFELEFQGGTGRFAEASGTASATSQGTLSPEGTRILAVVDLAGNLRLR